MATDTSNVERWTEALLAKLNQYDEVEKKLADHNKAERERLKVLRGEVKFLRSCIENEGEQADMFAAKKAAKK